MHRGEALAQRTLEVQQRGRARSIDLECRFVLGRLLGDVGVQRRGALSRPAGDGRRRFRVHRADAVDRGADPRRGAAAELANPDRPGVDVGVEEALLDRVGLDPPVEVAGVEQGQPDARVFSASQDRVAHRVGLLVGGAARPVVDVVELPTSVMPASAISAKALRARRCIVSGSSLPARDTSPAPPCPERPRRALGAPAQRPLEGV